MKIKGSEDAFQDYTEQVLLCEDSQEGIFTGIYEAYEKKFHSGTVRIVVGEEREYRLFAVYHKVEPDTEKALKVARTVSNLTGPEPYRQMCTALSSTDPQKGQAVFGVIELLLKDRRSAQRIMDRLADGYVRKVFELHRNVQNEIHHLKEFLRFQELENKALFARIGPYNDVVMYLMPHFADRFPQENFMIYDEGRNLLGVHPASGEWYLARGVKLDRSMLNDSDEEKKYRELFRFFCHKIAIKERKNLNLQRNMLPLRFREFMVEFGENDKNAV